MGEASGAVVLGGGCFTGAVALAALVISCLAFVQSKDNESAINAAGGVVVAPSQLHGTWQVCGLVNSVMLTGDQNAPFDALNIELTSGSKVTYVFRPAIGDVKSDYLFRGDRCGFYHVPAPGLDPVLLAGDSPTMGSLSPKGDIATFFQYYNTTDVLTEAGYSQPTQVSIQHQWYFDSKDTATVSIHGWYPSNNAFNGETGIWGWQSAARYKRVGDYTTCEDVANAAADFDIDSC